MKAIINFSNKQIWISVQARVKILIIHFKPEKFKKWIEILKISSICIYLYM